MIAFMRALEPRRYKKDEVIMRDLEEVEEIIFVLKGEVRAPIFIIISSLPSDTLSIISHALQPGCRIGMSSEILLSCSEGGLSSSTVHKVTWIARQLENTTFTK